MIRYIEELFLTEKTAKKLDTIKTNIENKKWFSKVCLITLSNNENDVFDIIQLYNLKTAASVYEDIIVIGIVENKGKAVAICSEIVNQYINSSESERYPSMRAYLVDKYL